MTFRLFVRHRRGNAVTAPNDSPTRKRGRVKQDLCSRVLKLRVCGLEIGFPTKLSKLKCDLKQRRRGAKTQRKKAMEVYLRRKQPSSLRVMSIVREPNEYESSCFQMRNSNDAFVPMLSQRSNRFRQRLITRSDDGYFERNLTGYFLLYSLRPCALAPLR